MLKDKRIPAIKERIEKLQSIRAKLKESYRKAVEY